MLLINTRAITSLPKLKPNESIDLFFGMKVGRLSDVNEEVQLSFTHKTSK